MKMSVTCPCPAGSVMLRDARAWVRFMLFDSVYLSVSPPPPLSRPLARPTVSFSFSVPRPRPVSVSRSHPPWLTGCRAYLPSTEERRISVNSREPFHIVRTTLLLVCLSGFVRSVFVIRSD